MPFSEACVAGGKTFGASDQLPASAAVEVGCFGRAGR